MPRCDYEYERAGTASLFLAPLIGWRHVNVTEQRAAADFAHCMAGLVYVHIRQVNVIRVLLENLNTHTPAALYGTDGPNVAREIGRKLEFHCTPEHGCWLNMAEVELSVLGGRCPKWRLGDEDRL